MHQCVRPSGLARLLVRTVQRVQQVSYSKKKTAWDWNYAVLKKGWPKIAKAVAGASLDGCQSLEGTPSQALIYRDRQVTSAFDPLDEAKLQAEGLNRDAEAVYCYGIGLGHLPAVLAARHKHVCVVLMNLNVARAAFESAKQKWLTAPHVGLALAADVPILYAPYACVPMECRYADAQGYAMRDRLFAHLNDRYNKDYNFSKNLPRDQENVVNNKKHVDVDRSVDTLFGTASGKRMAVVGSGPSLAGEMGWLRDQMDNGVVIVAASTALKALSAAGVAPDVVVSVDTDPRMVTVVDGVSPDIIKQAALVYHPTVSPELLAAWTGPRYYYIEQGELYASGTVVHVATDLATKMGASQITLVGCDFCYPGAVSHVAGAPDFNEIRERSTLLETRDGHGNMVHTDFNLTQFHRHLEDYIAQNKQGIKWFKRGKTGVPVRGVEWS